MKVTKITPVGKKEVYDIAVADAEHYILENGVVSHNSSTVYSSDTVLIIGRQQEKDGTELSGYNFVINVDKSRFVKEKSKIFINVSFETGIQKYSGLLDIAIEGKFIEKGRFGKSLGYAKIDRATGEIGKMLPYKKTNTEEFWGSILADKEFNEFVHKKFAVSYGSILHDEDTIESDEMDDYDFAEESL